MGIQSNELRIGNLVNCEQTTHRVVGIDNYYIKSYWLSDDETLYEMKKSLVKPIPLDEGWLERFGYENWGVVEVNEYESYKRYVLHNFLDTSNHEVHIIHMSYGGFHYTDYITSIDMDERQYNWRLEFVHDLQNAVYKETGKELKTKQP